MMLINTVIIFLRDLLPIFILLCLVTIYSNPVTFTYKTRFFIVFGSLAGVWMTFYSLPKMAELFGGVGIEVIKSIELVIVYFCMLLASTSILTRSVVTSTQKKLVAIALILFFIINVSEFIVFLDSYIASSQTIKEVLAGLSIGMGICLSLSALLYFLLNWFIKKELFILLYMFLALFLSGQISQLISLLQQVDMIKSSAALWDSSNIIDDSSEYGHLFKTLFGYEASPSVEFIMLYGVSLLIFLIYFFVVSADKSTDKKRLKGDVI